MTEQNLISTAQAAELSGLSQPQIQKLCRDGVIPAQKVGSTYVIPAEWAMQFADTVGPGVAARAAGVSRQTIYTAIADGTLVTVMGNRIAKPSLAEYIRARLGDSYFNEPYLWGRLYGCMLTAVRKGAPELERGFDKQMDNYQRTPWKIFPVLHRLYFMACRSLSKQDREAAGFLMDVLFAGINYVEDKEKRLDCSQQSDVCMGIMHGSSRAKHEENWITARSTIR